VKSALFGGLFGFLADADLKASGWIGSTSCINESGENFG
jgi:hypothetical protein